jgi:hypothetical protein
MSGNGLSPVIGPAAFGKYFILIKIAIAGGGGRKIKKTLAIDSVL